MPLSPRSRIVSSPPTRQNSTGAVTPDPRHHPTVVAILARRGRPEGTVTGSGIAASSEASPERSSGSSRCSGNDDEDAEESTGHKDEEEEEEQKRKTALSAGTEKISRHHA